MLEELCTIFVSCGFQASLFAFSDFADYLLVKIFDNMKVFPGFKLTFQRLQMMVKIVLITEASGMMVGQKAIYRSKICEGSRLLRREASLLPLSAEKRRRPSGVKEGLWPRAGDFLPLAKNTTRSLRPEWTAVLQKTVRITFFAKNN